jgi:hypothetical protein
MGIAHVRARCGRCSVRDCPRLTGVRRAAKLAILTSLKGAVAHAAHVQQRRISVGGLQKGAIAGGRRQSVRFACTPELGPSSHWGTMIPDGWGATIGHWRKCSRRHRVHKGRYPLACKSPC